MEQFDQVVRKLNDMTNRNVMAIAAMVEQIAESHGVGVGTDPSPHSIIDNLRNLWSSGKMGENPINRNTCKKRASQRKVVLFLKNLVKR